MTVTTPVPALSTHRHFDRARNAANAKGLEPPEAPVSPPTSLAAFSKHGRLLSPRDKDAASSASTARTSSVGSNHDCRSDCGNDLHWDDLSSTSSSGEPELDAWSPATVASRGHHGVGTSTLGTAGAGPGAWRESRDARSSHKLHHAASGTAPTARPGSARWSPPSPVTVTTMRRASVSAPVSIPGRTPQRNLASSQVSMLMPSHRHLPMTPPHTGAHAMRHAAARGRKEPAFGSPLRLMPVNLAALASTSNVSPSSSSFAPRLRPVVHAINIGPPTEYDFRNTNGLMKCVDAIAQLPSPDELSAKHLVINELQRIVDEWMRRSFPDEEDATATLLLGGSWHLKVGLSDSDLDIVVLLPKFVTSELFFASLHDHLKAKASVSKLVAMNNATVPILAFQLSQVRIDLLFARFTRNVVPKNLPIHSDQILAGMDATSIRSLSVPRVASLILELVPNDGAFRSCLRIVRLWAKRRGIYSNKAGFLGGVSWTILVAFVCQMFPRATISSVIHRFFSLLSTWNWPTPILLAKPYECSDIDSSLQWCPQKNHHDRAHVMPIITPGFPAVNSAVNVNASTLRILKEEFARGKLIMDDMLSKGLSSPAVWQRLFAPSEFLVQYDHYVAVEVKAANDDELTEWSNFVASRTRKLVKTLELTAAPIQEIHPFPELVKPQSAAAAASHSGFYFIGFKLHDTASTPGRLRRSSSASSPPKSRTDDVVKDSVASAIRYFVATELEKCPERRDGMSVAINYTQWHDLPESIFPQGRTVAAGERARHILSRAHTTHVALGFGR